MLCWDRRRVITSLAAAGGLPLLRAPAWSAATRDEIVEGAKKEGAIRWYEAFTRDEGEQILKAFQRDYPFVQKFEYSEIGAAQKQARFMQESLAGGPTTDVFLSSSAGLQEFVNQKMIVEGDWAALGIPHDDVKAPSPNFILYTTSVFVGIYNPNKVSEAEAPKTWDDLVDPKWKGRTGAWARAVTYTVLSSAWGEDKARDYVKRLAALQPRLFTGTLQVAQAIAAGEVDIGVGSLDATTRVAMKGAPVKMANLDLTPISLLYGAVARYGKNPNTARLLIAWLASEKGALAFEKATQRGNHLWPETNTAKFLQGKKITFFKSGDEIARSAHLNTLENEFATMLQRRG